MYKIIYNKSVIDVVEHPIFIKFLKTGHITITNKSSANGIVGSDNTPYSLVPHEKYKKVSIAKISEKEFKRLQSLLNSNESIMADDATLAKTKKDKIAALSSICKNKIIAGFSVELSSGIHSFKLTTEDQINLLLLENQLQSGETSFIYHATEEPCKIYSRDDMQKIIKAYKVHLSYHTTYFNLAKQYINSLTDSVDVNKFSYGNDVAEVTADPELLKILEKRGKCE